MADLTPHIETMENRWMRAWVQRDVRTLKSITAKDFILLTASRPPAILDRPSWLEAVGKRYFCSAYSFGDIYVRDWGPVALFAAPLELKATMDGASGAAGSWRSASSAAPPTIPSRALRSRRFSCGSDRLGARLGEQRRFAPAADALRDFGGVVRAGRVAAAVAQEDGVERVPGSTVGGRGELDLGPLVVASGKVEADRSAAAAAILAVALTQGGDALRLLLAAELPRGHIFGDDRSAHALETSRDKVTKKLRRDKFLWKNPANGCRSRRRR